MGSGNLCESDIPGDLGRQGFVFRIPVAVHENDGRRPDAFVISALKLSADRFWVRRRQHVAGGVHALVHLDRPFVKHLGEADVALEQVGAVLVADSERVGESLGDDKDRTVAGALQKRVCGHRGSHPDDADVRRRDRIFGFNA